MHSSRSTAAGGEIIIAATKPIPIPAGAVAAIRREKELFIFLFIYRIYKCWYIDCCCDLLIRYIQEYTDMYIRNTIERNGKWWCWLKSCWLLYLRPRPVCIITKLYIYTFRVESCIYIIIKREMIYVLIGYLDFPVSFRDRKGNWLN